MNKQLIQAVRDHATDNYGTDGWDMVVETMDDDDIAEAIGKARTKNGAIKKVAEIALLWDEQRIESLKAGGEYDEDEPEGEEIEEVTGSKIRQKYRQRYAEQATNTGHKAHTATGRNSLNNGDQLAIAMENLLPSEVCDVADDVFKQPKGTHATKYGHLNEGMRRMNAGNRIRGAVKRNEISVEDALNLIGETFLARPPLSE